MAKGRSGRIVVELDPELKQRLHALLALKGYTLKDWFVEKAIDFVGDFGREDHPQGTLFQADEEETAEG